MSAEVKPGAGCPKGYKLTEVGVIPEEWKCVESVELAEYRGGNTFKSADATAIGVRWLKIANVGKQRSQWNETSFLPDSFAAAFPDYLLRDGDVVMALTRPIIDNELKIAKLTSADTPCLLNQRVAKVCARPNGVLDFLYHVLQTAHFVDSMNEAMAGSDPPNIGTKTLGKIFIAAPSDRDEQRAIATALSDVDGLLSGLDRLIAKKRDLKQAAMQQLLTGQTRLPGFHGEWEVKAIQELSQVGRGRVISHTEISKSASPTYPVFSSQTSDSGIMGCLDTYDFEGDYVTWTTDGANAGTVFARTGRFNCTNVCGTIKLHDSDHRFIAAALGCVSKSRVSRHLGNPKLMNDVMKKIQITIPQTRAEQTAIAEVLTEMDAELAALTQRREKTRALKQAMMQELLTGRTRLL